MGDLVLLTDLTGLEGTDFALKSLLIDLGLNRLIIGFS